jgi:hypothetical protein
MADRTLTVTSVGEAPKTLTINRDRFAGVRTMTRVEAGGETTVITVNRTASGVRTGEKSGQSRPLLNKVVGGAAAAYSLRDLNDGQGPNKVVRVRRSSDNKEKDITAKELPRLTDWVTASTDLPLDNSTSLIAAGMNPTEQYAYFNGASPESTVSIPVSTVSTTARVTFKVVVDNHAATPAFGALLEGSGISVFYTSAAQFGSSSSATTSANAELYIDDILCPTRLDAYNVLVGEQVHEVRIENFVFNGNDLKLMVYPSWGIYHTAGILFDLKIDLTSNGTIDHAYTGVGASAWTDTVGQANGVLGSGMQTIWGDGLAVAYSLRNLSDSYVGPVVDVVRSLDAEIKAFTAAEVSDGTMLTWVGTGLTDNGYVSKLYDQSGNGNHAIENASGWGPQVVENGVQCLEGGKPTIKCDELSDYLVIDKPIIGGDTSTFAVYKTTVGDSFIYRNANANSLPYAGRQSNGNIVMSHSGGPVYGGAHPNQQIIVNFQTVDSSISINTDGVALVEQSTTEAGGDGIGSIANIVGTYSEIVIYTSNKTDDRNTITSNMGDYYNIDMPAGIDTGNNEVDGFVSVWYDQSGNGKDIAQPTATRQPKIVDQGTLIKNTDGQVSTSFNKATADELAASGFIDLPCYTFVYCEDLAGASATHRPLFGGASGRGLGIMQGGGIRLYHGSGITTLLPTVTGPKVITALSKPVGAAVYENGILRAFGDVGALALPYVVGGRFGWDGDLAPDLLVSEVIIFNGDQSANRPAIEANMNNQYGISQSSIPPTQFGSRLLFHGATSALGLTNYQIGQLIHRVTIDSSGNSTVSVSKTDNSTDVNISSFNNLGTVSSNRASSFVIRAIGNRNGVNSAIQGANTDDSVGVVGQGNPGKLDVFNGNETEFITFEVVNLNPALTISIKTVYVIRANFMGTTVPLDRPIMVLTPFAPLDPLNPKISVEINKKGHAIKDIPVSSSQMELVGTGTGTNGSFKIGVSSLQGGNVGYGLYAIDFDVTG